MRLLVTGGAGYIGSHFVSVARQQGRADIVVVDDFSTGLRQRVPADVPVYTIDLASDAAVAALTTLLKEESIDVVVHFAAKKVVADSVVQPEDYFRSNVGATVNVLAAMRAAGAASMIFSSSAAVYGEPDSSIVFEDTPTVPINPYGQSKLVSELSSRERFPRLGSPGGGIALLQCRRRGRRHSGRYHDDEPHAGDP
nr:NAD-dependent epimerase/dehydratase family protein [Micrococcus luteus]